MGSAARVAPFVAVEGIDGAGTTTQVRLAGEWLRGKGLDPLCTREPSDGPIGRHLRSILSGETAAGAATVALLFAADRLDHVAREIDPARRAGRPVISDRYLLSSLAYQGVECDPAWVQAINRLAPSPDLTVLVRVRPEVAAARRRARGQAPERFDADAVQAEVAARYDRLAAERGARVLDGERPAEEVFAELRALVEPVL